ncbi:MAG: oligosaccharide flippase family protein [Prevotella sp.]|nr:oligosaccharide flippase family protein [Prevotella sp.]
MSENSYRHILKYTGVFGSVQGLNVLLGLVRNKFVALILGPSGMGLVSLLNTTLTFMSQATNLGIATSAVRHVSELFDAGDEVQLRHYIKVVRAWCLVAAVLGMALCFVVAPLLDVLSFSWGNHTLHFFLLAPAVAMLAVTGGETAILKATRRLRSLAMVQVWTAVGALCLCVPLYYFFGEAAIVPVIVLTAFVSMVLTIVYSYRFYPLQLKGARQTLHEGIPMVKLGVAFIMASVVGSGSEMFIRFILNVKGNLDDVGLYNAAYMMTVTYAATVFSAIDADYFPRLSAVNQLTSSSNALVNRQLEMSLLMVAPMLVAFIIGLPILVPLLFSHEFLPIVSMTQLAALSMYLKVLTLPVAYLTLARGQSRAYFVLETLYYVFFVFSSWFCYVHWGLYGMGVALLAAHVFDLLMIHVYARRQFGYRVSHWVVLYALAQVGLGVLAFGVTFIQNQSVYWGCGVLLFAVSLIFSLSVIRRKI